MLQAMRNNTRIILWVTVVAFVLLIFLVWGADLSLNSGPTPGTVGSVNGESIPVATYQAVVAQNRQMSQSQARGLDLQPSDYLRIEEDSWNSIIDETLLRQEAERQGIVVLDSEVRTILLNDPPPALMQDPAFQNEAGVFDLGLYQARLRTAPRDQILYLEASIRSNIPLQRLQSAVVSAARVTDDEVRREWLDNNETATVSWTLIPLPNVAGGTELSDAELSAYFEEHRETYALPERADLNYVMIPRRATAADTAQIVADLRSFRREALDAARSEATGDENLSASDFETLVMTFSDSPTAAQGGLSTGFMAPAEMSPALRRAVQDLPVDGISEPYLDGPMYHIVQVVDEKTEAPEGSDAAVRHVQIRDLAIRIGPSDSTVAEIRNRFEETRALAQESGLKAAAEKHGLELQTAGNITASGFNVSLATIPSVTSFALHNPKGTVSRVYETNNGWYLLEVAEVKPAGVPPLDEVKARVQDDARRDRQFELSKRVADQLAGRIKMGSTLEDAAAQDSLTVAQAPSITRRSGIPALGRGPEPEVLGAAFGLPVGRVSEPIRSSAGWVLLRVDERPPVDEARFAEDANNTRLNLVRIKQNQLYQAWLEQLRNKAEIVDYRS